MKHNEMILFLASRINYKVDRYLTDEFKAHGITGISASHGEILAALSIFREIQMKDIPEKIDRDKSTVTALVNKLISMDLVEKTEHSADRRASLIKLSAKGETLRPALADISARLREKAYRNLSEEEKTMMMELLAKINTNL